MILKVAPLNHVQSNARSWQEYQELINKAWAKGPAAYNETAERLVEAKAELARDVFESLTKLNRLNFDSSVSRKLLCIGKNRVLCCAPGHKLPAGWTIAYELSKARDDVLKAALADGRINPRMKRKDAVELHTPAKPKPPTTPPTETKPETLTEHWRRAPAELTTLLDDVGFAGVREAMSKKFAEDMRKAQPTKSFCQHDTNTMADKITEMCAISKVEALANRLLKFVGDKRALSGAKRKNSGTSKPKGITLKTTEYARH